jgi:hypothetical protein
MINNELLEQIKTAATNTFHLNAEDKRRVVCIFYELFKQGKFNSGDVEDTIEALPKEFTNVTKFQLHDIAFVIDALAYC